jgi:hypothetical protein
MELIDPAFIGTITLSSVLYHSSWEQLTCHQSSIMLISFEDEKIDDVMNFTT